MYQKFPDRCFFPDTWTPLPVTSPIERSWCLRHRRCGKRDVIL